MTRAFRTPDRKNSLPRRVRDGIKLRGKDAPLADNWLARQWLQLFQSSFDQLTWNEGLEYARLGQVMSLEVTGGELGSKVQGHDARPHLIALRLGTCSTDQWNAILDAMAVEAIYAARLLTGELPESISTLFISLGAELLPSSFDSIGASCTCDEPAPCRHIAAVAQVVTEQIDERPLMLFALRGMNPDQVQEQLRQRRAILAHGVASAHGDMLPALDQVAMAPLESCLDDFWRMGHELAEGDEAPPVHHVTHALLRRLGPSPLKGKFPLVGLLASAYDEIAAAARRLQDRGDSSIAE
jgi:uncharacterized Zn finger protein